MSDLISREALQHKFAELVATSSGEQNIAYYDALREINWFPAVVAVEVVRAEWKFDHMTGETAHYADCSICGVHKFFKDVSEYSNFCPNCGAKMGKRRESEVSE